VTVRRLLLIVTSSSAVVMLLVGLIGSWAVHESTETVDTLSQELSPAQVANAEFMAAMLDAETELRAYLISGERRQLADHRAALALAPVAEANLEAYVRHHPELAPLVAQQDRHARTWVRDFADVAIAAGPAADRDRAMFNLGVRHFDAIKDVNRTIASRLQAQVTAARADSQKRLDETVALIAVFGLCSALFIGLLSWRVMRGIRRPLTELENVVDRLASGEHEARARVAGPTEIRRLGRAINEMAEENTRAHDVEQQVQERLLETDRVKSEFVASVSHELRTPLTSISGYLELLSEDIGDQVDAEHAEMMQVMRRNTTRLRGLIEELLDLGRVEREPDVLQSVDVALLLEDVVKDLRLSAGTRHVSITIDVDAADRKPVVLADAAQLHRALLNLLSNAVKFSHEGGDVRLHLGTDGEQVEVTVTDTGIGIPGADQDKVGERFYRASNAVTAHIPGTGLGLRMVQAIVSHHQGTFGLSSQEGRGTRATLRLPLQRASEPPAEAPASQEQAHSLQR
jgi:two-component system OmpR family sensor kinase